MDPKKKRTAKIKQKVYNFWRSDENLIIWFKLISKIYPLSDIAEQDNVPASIIEQKLELTKQLIQEVA
jgi:hypothetical protein